MRACRSVLLACLVLIGRAAGGVAAAAEGSARDFLDAICADCQGKNAKGWRIDDVRTTDGSLRALFKKR